MNPAKRLFGNPEKVRRIGLTLFISALVVLLVVAHLVSWPLFMTVVDNAKGEGPLTANLQLCMMMSDNLLSLYQPHCLALMQADTAIMQGDPLDSILHKLIVLPGITDAFFIDFPAQKTISINNVIPDTTMMSKLDQRSNRHAGGATAMTRRLVGGAVKFRGVSKNDIRHPVIVRYIGTYYASYATKAIGLVLDDNWFTTQIPSRLDSLTQQSTQLLFYSPPMKDTLWNATEDPFAGPGGAWKMTAGVLRGGEEAWKTGGDTLWWFGERGHKVVDWGGLFGSVGYWMELDEFNLVIGVRTETMHFTAEVDKRVRAIAKVFIGTELLAFTLIVFLYLSIRLIRHQSRRNTIALAHLAHSVKTPVARLQLAADILEGGQVSTPDEERKIIETVSGECRQLRRAVENAALSMEGGKIAVHKEPGDLAELVREIAMAWQTSFDQAGIRLVVEGDDKPTQASFDRDKLRLALDNLLDNALRHTYLNLKNITNGEAVVLVSLRSIVEKVTLSISDSGAGIPKADMKNVFKRFGRSGKDPLTGVSGLGLGLALVKEIVEGHGGKVKAESAQAGGAKFIIEMTND